MREDIAEIFNSLIWYVRENHQEAIDRAYEFFWEEDLPEDFLGGTALDIAFINFEDWLLCDYLDPEEGRLIDLYIKEKEPDAGTSEVLRAMKESFISLYEVVSSNGEVLLRDLILGEEARIKGPDELKKGDVFATRFIEVGGERFMSRCVYPFSGNSKDAVLADIDAQFKRYIKNKNPEGTMRQFLKEESHVFNTVWVTSIFKPR
jgi:hypothetical protein